MEFRKLNFAERNVGLTNIIAIRDEYGGLWGCVSYCSVYTLYTVDCINSHCFIYKYLYILELYQYCCGHRYNNGHSSMSPNQVYSQSIEVLVMKLFNNL